MKNAGTRALAALTALSLLCAARAESAQSGITAGPQLARIYDAIFDAQFDRVPALMADACRDSGSGTRDSGRSSSPEPRVPSPAKETTPAAPEACQLLEVVALWWRIQLDPRNRSYDEEFLSHADATIAAIEAWTEREPMRAEAWFYLGGAYGARAQWRVLREERLAAARDGKRIKSALEHALELDPSLQDAYFGIGLYHYYADVAPSALKMLRWLLLLPGGDKDEGLDEMLRARSSGQLLRSEADYQLHLIYLWYEKQPDRALQLVRGLHDRHPRNPLFPQLIAGIEDVYLHDRPASLTSWQSLLVAAQAKRVAEPSMAAASANLGIASLLDRMSETESALPHLRTVIESKASAPIGALARAYLQLGQAFDHLGRRSEAVSAYRSALGSIPHGDPDRIESAVRAGLRTPHVRTTQ